MNKLSNTDIQGVLHVRRTCKANESHQLRTLTSPMVSGNVTTAMWGRPPVPDCARGFSYLTGSTPVTPQIIKSQMIQKTETKIRVKESLVTKIEQEDLYGKEVQMVEKRALDGLAKCLKGYVLKEVKRTYELNAEGEKQLKSEVVVQKQVAPDYSAIVFTLTNLKPQKWSTKPSFERDEVLVEDELVDLSALPEEQLVALLSSNS